MSSAFRFDRNLSITENSMILGENYDTSDMFYHWQRNCTIRNRCHVILVVLHVNFLFTTCHLIAIWSFTNRPKSKKKNFCKLKKKENVLRMIFKIDLKLFVLESSKCLRFKVRSFFYLFIIFFLFAVKQHYNARNHQFMFSSMLLTYV